MKSKVSSPCIHSVAFLHSYNVGFHTLRPFSSPHPPLLVFLSLFPVLSSWRLNSPSLISYSFPLCSVTAVTARSCHSSFSPSSSPISHHAVRPSFAPPPPLVPSANPFLSSLDSLKSGACCAGLERGAEESWFSPISSLHSTLLFFFPLTCLFLYILPFFSLSSLHLLLYQLSLRFAVRANCIDDLLLCLYLSFPKWKALTNFQPLFFPPASCLTFYIPSVFYFTKSLCPFLAFSLLGWTITVKYRWRVMCGRWQSSISTQRGRTVLKKWQIALKLFWKPFIKMILVSLWHWKPLLSEHWFSGPQFYHFQQQQVVYFQQPVPLW